MIFYFVVPYDVQAYIPSMNKRRELTFKQAYFLFAGWMLFNVCATFALIAFAKRLSNG